MKTTAKRLLALFFSALLALTLTAAPAMAASGTVSVLCRDENNNYFTSYTVTLTGSQYVYPQLMTGYTSVSEAQYISMDSYGRCTPNYIIFDYVSGSAPNIMPDYPQSGNLEVFCRDRDGKEILKYYEDLNASQYISAREIPGYTVLSGPKYIIFNSSSNSCTPNRISFYYEGSGSGGSPYTPPVPTSGTVQINCLDENGTVIKSNTRTLSQSQYIYPESISGYRVVSSAQYVTFDTSTGRCSPSQLVFYYHKQAVQGNVRVTCADPSGNVLSSYNVAITSSQYVEPRALSGYKASSGSQYVNYDSSTGTCNPSQIYFYYQKESVSGQVYVTCADQNGNTLSSYTVTITSSQYVAPKTFTGYQTTSRSEYVTFDSSTGRCSPDRIIFYYQPESRPATVSVYCYDQSGNSLSSYSLQITGDQYVQPRAISGYKVVSSAQYVAYNASAGTCSPSRIDFYYQPEARPASVTVICEDENGNRLNSYSLSVTASQNVQPRAINGYRALSSGQYVTYNPAASTCSPERITFRYQRDYSSGQVTVICVDDSGTTLDSYTVTVTGNQNISPKGIKGYRAVTGAQAVTLDRSTGTCSPSQITFRYQRDYSSGQVTVICADDSGTVLDSYTVTVTGNEDISPKSISGYRAVTGAQAVKLDRSTGTCSPSQITFTYQREYTSGKVKIVCRDTLGNQLDSYTVTVKGKQSISPKGISGYRAVSSAQTVKLNTSTGKCSPSSIEFIYEESELPSQIVPVDPIDGFVNPLGWDTQFRVGVTTHSENEQAYTRLPNLSDNNQKTRFWWTFWTSERKDDIPDLSAYFDHVTISAIQTRNGNVSSSDQYYGNARVRVWTLGITHGGNYDTVSFTIPDNYTNKLQTFGLGRTFKDVTQIDFFLGDEGPNPYYNGSNSKHTIYVTDILFSK